MIQSGHTSINPLEWIGKTKEEFFEVVTGHLDHDKEDVWKWVLKAIKENECTGSIGAENKKPDSKRTDKGTKRG